MVNDYDASFYWWDISVEKLVPHKMNVFLSNPSENMSLQSSK